MIPIGLNVARTENTIDHLFNEGKKGKASCALTPKIILSDKHFEENLAVLGHEDKDG
jgi:hypothetical protein